MTLVKLDVYQPATVNDVVPELYETLTTQRRIVVRRNLCQWCAANAFVSHDSFPADFVRLQLELQYLVDNIGSSIM
jgi:hypothetical protein